MASEIAASAATVAPDRPDQPRHGKRGAPQAFARKLAEILRDESEEVIGWNEAGTAFMVKDVERFSQDVLVKHYRYVYNSTSTLCSPLREAVLYCMAGRGQSCISGLALYLQPPLSLPQVVSPLQKPRFFFHSLTLNRVL